MAVGLQPSKSEVDSIVGQQSKTLNILFEQAAQMNAWLGQQSDAELTALGYNAGDITTLRGAYSDLDELRSLYRGTATLAVAKNFRTNVRKLWGLGF
jgi:hypothetical protein